MFTNCYTKQYIYDRINANNVLLKSSFMYIWGSGLAISLIGNVSYLQQKGILRNFHWYYTPSVYISIFHFQTILLLSLTSHLLQNCSIDRV